ncbi:MAG: M6 family metalloprotease domain-containing protein [Elusimicrobia bacterium]|nr:M6 family metalloprotease domain-containing protein [Elusimicrobiota bacterium]
MGPLKALISAMLLLCCRPAVALDPPEGGRSDKSVVHYGIDPELGIESRSFSPELVSGLYERLSGRKSSGLIGQGGSGLPSRGRVKILVLLVEFDEYPARPGETAEAVQSRIFGSGGSFPFESLSAFYRRSSRGALEIEGNVLGWYKAGRRADVPQTRAGREELIKKALLSFKGHDFSQYDNNGDGAIDYFAVVWTGPSGDWATFWWGAAPQFSDKAFSVGGKTLGSYSWQGVAEDWADPSSDFRITTLIHETGHSLGLPDYYDYKPGVGPDGGLGYFDMMDSKHYDHNCFSKMMLGWVEPRVVNYDGEFSLAAAAMSGECLMVVPPGAPGGRFGEFFLVENRRRAGNDADPRDIGEGLVIWHVDARLNSAGNDFLFNNQDTEHKLLRAMEADGSERIEKGPSRQFTRTSFYSAGRELGPGTAPSSAFYGGGVTGLTLTSVSDGQQASFRISFR